ncbi:MAG: tetratricopeptide repeat protein [Flavobacteriaceae bacterium]|nr:tetratricopeptide repeat protein [Flavobacteriaceae bacterium]
MPLVFGQGKTPINKKYIDSVITTLDTVKTDFDKVRKLTRLAGENRYTPLTRKFIDKSIEISKIVDNPKHLAHSYYSLGNYYFFNSKMDSCLSYLDKAYLLTNEINEPLLQSSILSTKGGAYSKLGAVILAISTQMEAKHLLDEIDTLSLSQEAIRKFKGQNLVLNNSLANLYNRTEDYDKAIEYYEGAYKAALNLESLGNAAVILSNKGNLYIKMNRLEEGLEILKLGKKMKLENKLPGRFIASSDLNIGIAHFEMGNYEMALESYQKSLSISEANKSQQGIMEALSNRGILFNAYGRYNDALQNCEKAKIIALEINDSEHLIKTCDCLYQANNALGNFEESLQNHELYTKVKDSVFNEKNIRKITQVDMQYAFDKKEADQQLILEKNKRQKNQILIGLIASGLFALTLFIFFKKRLKYQKTITDQERVLQQQKITDLQQKNKLTAMSSMIEGQEAERLRIAKDLHDSLGGLLSTVKAHFGTIQEKCNQVKELPLAHKTNHLIDEACIEVRRISHNMMPHALTLSGLEGAVQDIVDNLNDQNYSATFEASNLSKMETTREVMMYRLIQEIISNIRKHADASSIFIQLFGHKDEINLIVEDDGNGFDYPKAQANGGLGLKSINSRVAFLDGTIEWDTQLGRGTNINITIPKQ